jgi:hypothetical protein
VTGVQTCALPIWTDLQQLCVVGDSLILQFGDAQLHALAIADCEA